jgi:hypothetical protein
MAGWQVALIAIGAAVVAAAAAIVLDRMLVRRRGVTAAERLMSRPGQDTSSARSRPDPGARLAG